MKRKRIVITIVSVIVLWLVVGITDFALVHNYKKPLFCVCTEPMQDGGSGKYVGLGYSFYIEGNFVTEDGYRGVTSYRGYLFGKEVSRGFWDEMIPGTDAFVMSFNEVRGYVLEKGYSQEQMEEALKGYYRNDVIASWGEPDGMLSGMWGDVWFLDEEKDRKITVYYDSNGYVENVLIGGRTNESETVVFHDKVFNKSELSEETLEWLEKYNRLSKEEQLCINYIPSELNTFEGGEIAVDEGME